MYQLINRVFLEFLPTIRNYTRTQTGTSINHQHQDMEVWGAVYSESGYKITLPLCNESFNFRGFIYHITLYSFNCNKNKNIFQNIQSSFQCISINAKLKDAKKIISKGQHNMALLPFCKNSELIEFSRKCIYGQNSFKFNVVPIIYRCNSWEIS